MNLNTIAESDLSFVIEDCDNGFGVNITFRTNGGEYPVVMQTTDIGYFIDLQSGTSVRGRTVELNGRISTIESLADDIPDKTWLVDYVDTNGKTWSASVADVFADRKLGIYKVILEAFNKNANI